MALYEHVFITRPDISSQQVETITQELTQVIEDKGGKVTKNEYWGLRSMAYKIKKNSKAHYTLLNIDGPPPALAEMERQERLHDDVIRFMSIRVDELEDGPSVMMQKHDKRDKRDRHRKGRD